MGRLQDYPDVTPSASDKFLVVQSTGQGLVAQTSKMNSDNPTGSGALSINRKSNTTIGNQSVAVGYNNEASGVRSFSEGANNVSSGNYSHSEGYSTTASSDMAHAEGSGTNASGDYSHAEGYSTTASGNRSHAEGSSTTSSGFIAHSEGYATTAGGSYGAHAEGQQTIANGQASHSEGLGTKANRKSQHCFGEYNVVDTSGADASSRGTYIEIVGKGSSDSNRSNARTLDWSGNETIAGTLTQSSDAKLKDVINEELPDVSAIKAVKFKWKENANRDESEHIGYLAQDVEKVLPYLVKEDAEGNKVLDYIAFLVAKVDSLEKRIAELEG